MKNIAVVLSALVALAVVGCGPSAEQEKMRADLATEVTTMVNDATSSLATMDNVAGQITSAIAGGDSLAIKFPKDATPVNDAVAQLKSAKDRLMSVKDTVSAWLQNYKTPDLATTKFDEVVSNLKKSKDELTAATTEIQSALGTATAALDGYNTVASGLMSRVAMKRK